MKRILLLIAVLFVYSAHGAVAVDWSIDKFDADITVNTDRTILVKETINVTFDIEKHGIYRDIPVSYRGALGNAYKTKLEVISATDKAGDSWQYQTSREGAYLRIKIGDPDVTITGPQTYVITYLVHDVLGFFKDHDELYWNVTGDQWEVPIIDAHATVHTPFVTGTALQTACYTGAAGSVEQNCNITPISTSVRFNALDFLTIVVGWPKGLIAAPTITEKVSKFLTENSGYLLPLLAFVLMYRRWQKKGKDPAGRAVIPVEYDAPDKLTPLEVGYLVHQKFDKDYISAELVYLASKGYLTIREIKKDGLISDSFDYELTPKKEWVSDAALPPHDQTILNGIFSTGRTPVLISSLQQKFYKTQAIVAKDVRNRIVDEKGYFVDDPVMAANKYRGLAIGLFVLAFFLPFPISYRIGIMLSGVVVFMFAFIMPQRTSKGVQAWQESLGFKQYLEMAEKDRVKWEEKENLFFQFLPYAMLFGVADKWAKAFEGIYQQPPEWYQGSSGVFSPLNFTHSMSSFSSYSNSSLSSTPPSHSSSSGFSGGFSGGGGGGGGGGSW